MTQSTINMVNEAGFAFRTHLNSGLQALATDFSGPIAPTETYPYMTWLDTSTAPVTLKRRNVADDGWFSEVAIATIAADTIQEKTAGAGVTVDGVLLKDGGIVASGASSTLATTGGALATSLTATATSGAVTLSTQWADGDEDLVLSSAGNVVVTSHLIVAEEVVAGGGVYSDAIYERAPGVGVTVDGVLLKDSTARLGKTDAGWLRADYQGLYASNKEGTDGTWVWRMGRDANGRPTTVATKLPILNARGVAISEWEQVWSGNATRVNLSELTVLTSGAYLLTIENGLQVHYDIQTIAPSTHARGPMYWVGSTANWYYSLIAENYFYVNCLDRSLVYQRSEPIVAVHRLA